MAEPARRLCARPCSFLLYAAGLILESAAGTTPWPQARPIVIRVALAALACLALVPLNPNGARLYRYPLDTVRSFELRSLIVEWLSPDFHQGMYLPLLFVVLLLIAAMARSVIRPWARAPAPDVPALSALDAVRHIPIFILLAMPVIVRALAHSSASVQPQRRRSARQFQPIVGRAALVLLAGFALMRWTSLARSQDVQEASSSSFGHRFLASRQPPPTG